MHVILVVEDGDAIRSNLARLLTLEGFEAVAAADGRSGLAQVSGKAVTARSDLYSQGVMLFEMLAGRRPFIAESLELLLARHLHADTPVLPAAHAALLHIVNKLMAKTPTTGMHRPTPCSRTSHGRAESPLRRSQQLTDRSVG